MNAISNIYKALSNHYGPQHWWPAESNFEIVVGAILTQNTNWGNVDKALANLREHQALSLEAMLNLPVEQLEQLIRPAGFFRQKSERLKLLCRYLHDHYQGDLQRWLQQADLPELRSELLSMKGIGPESADAILLYAGSRLSFVVDAYTRRIFTRLGILEGKEKYEQIRTLFMDKLPAEVELYNEYHALIVTHAQQFCRPKPLCEECPLNDCCRHASEASIF